MKLLKAIYAEAILHRHWTATMAYSIALVVMVVSYV